MSEELTLAAHRFKKIGYLLAALLCLVALDLLSRTNYLLFHSFVELFSIFIAVGIFVITLESRKFTSGGYLLFLGIAYFHVAIIDLLNLLTYKRMGIFPGVTDNLPTQLWLAARYLEGISLLLAVLFINRKPKVPPVVIAYLATVVVLLYAIKSGSFPAAFTEGRGLTAFKIGSEYFISTLIAIAALCVWRKRDDFERPTLKLLLWSMLVTIASEMCFTLFTDLFGRANEVGHLLKIISFFLLYQAIIKTRLRRPYEQLRLNHDQLENLVKKRTLDLKDAVTQLALEKNKLDEIVSSIDADLLLLDHNLNVVWVNRQHSNSKRFVRGEILGQPCHKAYCNLEELPDSCPAKQAFATGLTVRQMHPITDPDGSACHCHFTCTPIQDRTGNVTHVLELVQDVTAEQKRENELQTKHQELEDKTRELENFNRLFVDREFRIKELKERVKELENEIEKKGKRP